MKNKIGVKSKNRSIIEEKNVFLVENEKDENKGQVFDKIVPKPPDGKKTRKYVRKNIANKTESKATTSQPFANQESSPCESHQKRIDFDQNVNSVSYTDDKLYTVSNTKLQDENSNSKNDTTKRLAKKSLFHLSLNESTFSLIGENSGECLEMSSGLIVNKKRPDYDLHISIDESSEMNQSAAYIRDQIFDKNNEWNFETTSPGRYKNENNKISNSTTNEKNENLNHIDSHSVNNGPPSVNSVNGPEQPEWSNCRLYFLYNEVMGLICKPCFSISCDHCKVLSNENYASQEEKNKPVVNLLENMNNLLNKILLVNKSTRVVQISECFVYRYDDSDIYFNEVIIEVTGYLAASVWELEYSKLAKTAVPAKNIIQVELAGSSDHKNKESNSKQRRNSKVESLCYDSDYDDCSYLRSCVGNVPVQYARHNSNNSLRAFTPPLTCSSPTIEQVVEEKIQNVNITDKPFQLATVFEGQYENRTINEFADNDKDSLDGEDKTKSNESLFTNLSDSLDESSYSLHQRNNSNNNNNSNHKIYNNDNNKKTRTEKDKNLNELTVQATISQEQKEVQQKETTSNETLYPKKQKKGRRKFEEQQERPDDNLTTKELKEFARNELITQLKREYNITNSNLLNNSDTVTTELDSEDELQWFLQEKRKKLLNAEMFSTDSSDILPEDDEVRRINLQSLKQRKELEDETNSNIHQNKATTTDSIDNDQNHLLEDLRLEDSIGSAADSGLDSHTSISNSRSNDADNQQVISARTNLLKNYPPNDDIQLIFTRFDERMSRRNLIRKNITGYISYLDTNQPPYYAQHYPKSASHLVDSMTRIKSNTRLNIPRTFNENSTASYQFPRTQSANKRNLKQPHVRGRHNSFSQNHCRSDRVGHGIFREQNPSKYNLQKSFRSQSGVSYNKKMFPTSDELIILGQHIYQGKRKT